MSDELKTNEEEEQHSELNKTVPSKLENLFADFTYKFAKYIPESVHPNTITAIGITGGLLGGFCFFLGTFSKWFFIPAIIGLITHIVSDNLDGWIARNRNMKSAAGGYFDLMSDVLVCTFTLLFIGLSSYCHMASVAFSAPLYGIYMGTTMHYIIYYNEFPFPHLGPFEIHCTFILTAILNMIFGPLVLFNLWGISFYLDDVIMLVGTVGAFIEIGGLCFKLFFRLKKDKK